MTTLPERRSFLSRWRCRPCPVSTVALLLLAMQAAWLAHSATRHSPTLLEPAFLASGISHWKLERFELYRVNPPLPRMIAALPVLAAGCEVDWKSFDERPGRRCEFAVGEDFMNVNGSRSLALMTYARWACIPFSLIGGWFAFRWSRELFGPLAGLLTAWLWAFEPNLLAHAELVTPDAAAWSLGIVAGYAFWRWLQAPGWLRAAAAGIALGLAELTKLTWILLFGIWPLLWLMWMWLAPRQAPVPSSPPGRGGHEPDNQIPSVDVSTPAANRPGILQLAGILALAIYIVNAGYAFDGSGTRLGDFEFISDLLGGDGARGVLGNRFQGTVLASLPVPLPRQYVLGFDVQKRDFEHYGQKNYLRGEWRDGAGWWHYYLYGLLVKVPCGTWLLFVAVLAMRLAARPLAPLRDELVLVLPAAAILLVCSSQTSINEHLRYVFPALALVLIWLGQAAVHATGRSQADLNGDSVLLYRCLTWRRAAVILMLTSCVGWSTVSAWLAYPHQLAYFNEIAGGSRHGSRHLLGSSVDWGQDVPLAKQWFANRNINVPVTILARCSIHPGLYGWQINDPRQQWQIGSGLRPGYYLVGESIRMGESEFVPAMGGGYCRVPPELLAALRSHEPVARCGVLWVFHVPEETPPGRAGVASSLSSGESP